MAGIPRGRMHLEARPSHSLRMIDCIDDCLVDLARLGRRRPSTRRAAALGRFFARAVTHGICPTDPLAGRANRRAGQRRADSAARRDPAGTPAQLDFTASAGRLLLDRPHECDDVEELSVG
jgi:hypothetical protein